jgi:hypothetical protein
VATLFCTLSFFFVVFFLNVCCEVLLKNPLKFDFHFDGQNAKIKTRICRFVEFLEQIFVKRKCLRVAGFEPGFDPGTSKKASSFSKVLKEKTNIFYGLPFAAVAVVAAQGEFRRASSGSMKRTWNV